MMVRSLLFPIQSELQSSRLERAEKLAEKAKEDAQRVEGERVTLLSRLEQAQRRLAEAECRVYSYSGSASPLVLVI